MTVELEIGLVEGSDAGVEAILARHHQAMSEASPAESCHVMSAQALRDSGARVYALREATGTVCAVGALKALEGGAVELKSMHVPQEQRGKGFGAALLSHLLKEARGLHYRAAYLETGSDAGFAAARGLYEGAGFDYCPPFADYVEDPLSVFMSRPL